MLTDIREEDKHPMWNRLMFAKSVGVEEAKKSPCVRRKYAALIFDPFADEVYAAAHNNRVSRCCDQQCIREFLHVTHGHNTDLGAEVHSEQSLLVKYSYVRGQFLIVGFDKNNAFLYDRECWPCYSCARIIKEAGVISVWVPLPSDGFKNYLIAEILEEYEQELVQAYLKVPV